MIGVNVHLPIAEGSSDDEEEENVTLAKQRFEAGRQDGTFWFGNVRPVSERRGEVSHADIGADHQGDVGEAANRDEGAGQSVGGTIASPGRMRCVAMRKRCSMVARRES